MCDCYSQLGCDHFYMADTPSISTGNNSCQNLTIYSTLCSARTILDFWRVNKKVIVPSDSSDSNKHVNKLPTDKKKLMSDGDRRNMMTERSLFALERAERQPHGGQGFCRKQFNKANVVGDEGRDDSQSSSSRGDMGFAGPCASGKEGKG